MTTSFNTVQEHLSFGFINFQLLRVSGRKSVSLIDELTTNNFAHNFVRDWRLARANDKIFCDKWGQSRNGEK